MCSNSKVEFESNDIQLKGLQNTYVAGYSYYILVNIAGTYTRSEQASLYKPRKTTFPSPEGAAPKLSPVFN